METIKAYTDIEQSKKFAEILPIKSADMYYINGDFGKISIEGWENNVHDEDDIPCWSLAALLNLIPDSIYENTDDFAQLEITKRSVGYHDINDNIVIGTLAGNLVDACVGMIIKLKELNLL